LRARSPQPDRLDLARWIADPAHPLTARVAVNHFWQHLFGRGLVSTPEDFGVRGEPPSHPELLDWLACEFMQPGGTGTISSHKSSGSSDAAAWSRKRLLRLILTSATYRQASDTREEMAERDPLNTLLARQNRFRVESEITRDLFLDASGLLNRRISGPSFRPFLPQDVKDLGRAGAFQWADSEGPDRYRRGLYIYAQRTVPYPVSMIFDQANPCETCPRRDRSNTPLQALTLLNNPLFVECATNLAARIAALPARSPSERMERAFELCLARRPSPSERTRLNALWSESLCSSDGNEAAAFATVAQVLLNLDEFLTRE
jgi:hypothetical protein